MTAKIIVSWMMLVGLLAASTPALADAEADSKRWYKEGTKHYNLGEFEDAIKAYKEGYEAKADPVFLFNIAQSYRLWKKPDQAIFFYKSFLRNAPEAPNQPEVERRIQELQLELDKQGAAPPPSQPLAPPPPVAPTTPPPLPSVSQPEVREADGSLVSTSTGESSEDDAIYKQWWFWTAIGAVAVGTVVIIAASSGGDSKPKSDFPVVKVF